MLRGGRPISYSWGWGGAGWYGYYGPYFAPYPVYRSPLFWLTDFFFAATLQAAYDQQMADNAAAAQQAAYDNQQAMSAEVKQDGRGRSAAPARARAGGQSEPGGDPRRRSRYLAGIFNDGASHALVVHNPLRVDDGGDGLRIDRGRRNRI